METSAGLPRPRSDAQDDPIMFVVSPNRRPFPAPCHVCQETTAPLAASAVTHRDRRLGSAKEIWLDLDADSACLKIVRMAPNWQDARRRIGCFGGFGAAA